MERLTTKQALRLLGWTHRNTLYLRVRRGEIKCIKEGNRSYFLRSEIERYMGGEADANTAGEMSATKAKLEAKPLVYPALPGENEATRFLRLYRCTEEAWIARHAHLSEVPYPYDG